MNNILIDDLDRLDEGFITACSAIARTYSSEGRLALLDDNNNIPILSKDGASAIERIRFADKVKSFGAIQAIQGALRTLKESEDSTTTTCILQRGYLQNIKRKDFNKSVEKGIRFAVEEVKNSLLQLSKMPKRDDLYKIALTACNSDEEMASILMEAYDFSGKDGIIEVVKNENKDKSSVLKQPGMRVDTGVSSAFFFNSNKLTYEADDCSILCVSSWKKDAVVVQYIKDFYQSQGLSTPMLVVTERENQELRDTLIEFKKIGLNIAHVGLTAYSEFENVTLLEDIAKLTGSKIFDPSVKDQQIVLGVIDKVVVRDSYMSLIVKDVPSEIKDTIEELENLENKDNKILSRLKRLKGKTSLIEVGGLTPNSLREAFDRFEDGLGSIKSSSQLGYVSGGGSTFMYISERMKTKMPNKEQQRGYDLVKSVLREPFKQLLLNSNRKTRNYWWQFWRKDYVTPTVSNYGIGYDAKEDGIVNLFDNGIIDSTKSLTAALVSATDVGINMLLTSVIILFPKSVE